MNILEILSWACVWLAIGCLVTVVAAYWLDWVNDPNPPNVWHLMGFALVWPFLLFLAICSVIYVGIVEIHDESRWLNRQKKAFEEPDDDWEDWGD